MGRLIDPERRRRAREVREERRRRILTEADRSFVELPPADVDLDVIGRRADVKAGIVSMYFGSREELYMAVLRRRLETWQQDLETRLAKVGGRGGAGRVADDLAASLAARPELVRLLGVMGTMVEGCGDITAALGFSRWYQERLRSLAGVVLKRCRGGDRDEAARLIHRTLLLAGALGFVAFPRGAGVLAVHEAPHLAVDLEAELRRAVGERLASGG